MFGPHHVELHVTDGTPWEAVLRSWNLHPTLHPYVGPLHHVGQHGGLPQHSFTYRGLSFSEAHCHIFAGLCAVDSRSSVARTFQALQAAGLQCARMGVYKPRTSPYAFQGHGKACLPYVLELAGAYGIRVLAMELTHERHLDEVREALHAAGDPTGVMVQIGTRNAQNFELLKILGAQTEFPILFKRGFGISLMESLQAAEYVAHAGNRSIIFCLRGVKSFHSAPHRNLVDFGQLPAIKRLSRLLVCADPSHSVGTLARGADGIPDLFHATAQAVIAGANMLLVDCHPYPAEAWVDSNQALPLEHVPWLVEEVKEARAAYLRRCALARGYAEKTLE